MIARSAPSWGSAPSGSSLALPSPARRVALTSGAAVLAAE